MAPDSAHAPDAPNTSNTLDSAGPQAGRNLVVCCDGTGNLWSPGVCDTNVVRLFKALSPDDPQHQISYYDPGVGTPDGLAGTDSLAGLFSLDTVRRVAGLAWGDGVWANAAQAYGFLCRHYQPGDRIFLFGFSRGAFTVRVVSGLVHLFGLLRPGNEHLMSILLRLYRHPGRALDARAVQSEVREFCDRFCRPDVPVHFIGVWDTVETVGMSQLLGLGSQNPRNAEVKPCYRHVRHALALDELRWTFLPRLYTPPQGPLGEGRSFRQVWFRGAHSDVGGGYAEAGLSTITLQWMAGQAHDLGLRLDLPTLARLQGDPCDTIHSEVTLWPTWALVGVFQRAVDVRHDAVHASVRAREAVCGPQRVSLPPDMPLEPRHPLERWTASSAAPQDRLAFQRPPRWVLPAWLLCMALLVEWVRQHWGGAAVSLAWGQQLGLARTSGWNLGQSLLDWSQGDWQAVVALLRMDQLFVVLYTAALMLTVALWQQVPSARHPQQPHGRWLARVMLPLAIADLLENQCTLWALALVTPPDPAPGWWSHSVLVVLVTALETAFSAVKLALLVALMVLLLQMLLAWRPPRAAPRPGQE